MDIAIINTFKNITQQINDQVLSLLRIYNLNDKNIMLHSCFHLFVLRNMGVGEWTRGAYGSSHKDRSLIYLIRDEHACKFPVHVRACLCMHAHGGVQKESRSIGPSLPRRYTAHHVYGDSIKAAR